MEVISLIICNKDFCPPRHKHFTVLIFCYDVSMQKNQNLTTPIALLVTGILALFGGFIILTSGSIGPVLNLVGIVLVPSSLYTLSKRVASPFLSKVLKLIIVILVALAIYNLIMLAGGLGKIDTTGEAPPSVKNFALGFSSLIILLGLIVIFRKKSQ